MNLIYRQLYVFLATLYGGLIIGFTYDLYRIFRNIFKPKKIATFIEDFLFWIVISSIAVFVLLFSNEGKIRLYNFFGFFTGTILYNKLLSKFVIMLIIKIIEIIKIILYKILKIICYPIKLLRNILKKPLAFLKKKLRPFYFRYKRLRKLPERWYQGIIKQIKLLKGKK